MRKLMYKVSLFTNTWSKSPTTISLEEFIIMVRGKRWQVLVEGHRRCLEKGRKHDAQTIKDGMECIIPAGVCHKGHAQSNLLSLSLALCIDIDHTDERTKDIFVRACLLEYVLGAFVSISGKGIKLFIPIEIDAVKDYSTIYEATAKLVSTVLGVDNDGKCKDITHPCFGSYDPEAYYNPEAKAVNGFLPQLPASTTSPNSLNSQTSPKPSVLSNASTSFANECPPAKPGKWLPAPSFVQSYLALYPQSNGDRNGTVFRLSCAAFKRNIDPEQLTTELVRLLEEDSFRESEISRTVKSAYRTMRNKDDNEKPEDSPANSTKFQNSNIGFSADEKSAEKTQETKEIIGEEIIGEELREHTPTFPDKIFDWIPEIFRKCVSIARNKRERDGLLLSSITTVSSMLPQVKIRYNRRTYQPNLFCIVLAPSGANKSLIAFGEHLHKYYNEFWEKRSLKIEKEYKNALKNYTYLLHKARKKTDSPTPIPEEPEEPKLQYPLLPADISRAQLITHLINNQVCSSLLTSTELSSLSIARNQDYGHFEDILCKVFEHERISSSYKINGQRPLKADCPSMSAFFTGTPSSLPLLISTMEAGLYNRIVINTYSLPAEWQNVFEEEGVSADELFDELSMRFSQIALFLKDSPTEVKLTDTQKEKFNATFTQLLKETDLLGNDDLLGVVKRYGVITARICCIFSAIDKGTMRMETPEIYCPDPYFEAALAIVLCSFEHSKLVSSSVKSSSDELKVLQSPDRLSHLLSKLPQEFSAKDAKAVGEELNISLSTVYNLLSKGIKTGRISKLAQGMYIQKK